MATDEGRIAHFLKSLSLSFTEYETFLPSFLSDISLPLNRKKAKKRKKQKKKSEKQPSATLAKPYEATAESLTNSKVQSKVAAFQKLPNPGNLCPPTEPNPREAEAQKRRLSESSNPGLTRRAKKAKLQSLSTSPLMPLTAAVTALEEKLYGPGLPLEECLPFLKREPLTAQQKLDRRKRNKIKRAKQRIEEGVTPVMQSLKIHSEPRWQSPPCRHLQGGFCHRGSECSFNENFQRSSEKRQESAMKRNLQSSKPCKFLLMGSCLKGDSCPFSHDLRKFPCKFFHVLGGCSQGGSCRFSHEPITGQEMEKLRERVNEGHVADNEQLQDADVDPTDIAADQARYIDVNADVDGDLNWNSDEDGNQYKVADLESAFKLPDNYEFWRAKYGRPVEGIVAVDYCPDHSVNRPARLAELRKEIPFWAEQPAIGGLGMVAVSGAALHSDKGLEVAMTAGLIPGYDIPPESETVHSVEPGVGVEPSVDETGHVDPEKRSELSILMDMMAENGLLQEIMTERIGSGYRHGRKEEDDLFVGRRDGGGADRQENDEGSVAHLLTLALMY